MDTPNVIATRLSQELLRSDKAKEIRYWIQKAVADHITRNPAGIVPDGMNAKTFTDSLDLFEAKFDEMQVDKPNPVIVLSYRAAGVKWVLANVIVPDVAAGWAKQIIHFWDYSLGNKKFAVVSVHRDV